MSNIHQHNEKQDFAGMKKFRLADFFNQWWNEYLKKPKEPVLPWQLKAVNALRVCRTGAFGIEVYACESCGEIKETLYSCKNRFCPTCSWKDTMLWAEKTADKMLNVPHKHVIFTLPHQVLGLVKRNQALLYNALMRAAADTLLQWTEHKFGIRPGLVMVLHTFGEKKNYHVHVHIILSWGGLDIKDKSLKNIDIKHVPFIFLRKKFRWLFEQQIVELYEKKKLQHNFANKTALKSWFKTINRKPWNIRIEGTINNPQDVIRYIGRYSKRCCLSEYKITEMQGENISFRYKDYKDKDENNKAKEKILSLHYRDFFPLLLQHVPLPNFRMVRYYGVYARRDLIPEDYISGNQILDKEVENETKKMEACTAYQPMHCQHCNQSMAYQYSEISYYRSWKQGKPKDKITWQKNTAKHMENEAA